MAKLVPLKDQLKQPVEGEVKVTKSKTGPVLPGRSTGKTKTAKAEKGPSKMDCSREVYNRMLNQPRKDVVMAFVAECGLTLAGAGTYYQLHKKSAES